MQRSFDDLGTPLVDTTFVVVDLETTGGSPQNDAITEIGAVKLRGGECLGTFATLVNPGRPIPPSIVYLTGITDVLVLPAPSIDVALPSFLEFLGNAVVVGHNVRFDMGFLQANAQRLGYRRLGNTIIDTCSLARRLVRDEVPNCKLETLARHFRTSVKPCHRALDDALATADVLHSLIERAGPFGATTIDDLVALPKAAGHREARKLKLTVSLPRAPGVYLFRDSAGRVLYVGKAANLRQRVRSYFSTDERRKVGNLLRETAAIDHEVCAGDLEAGVREIRLIHEHEPRYNRQVKQWRRYVYVKLTRDRFPRLSIVAKPSADGALHIGPLPSRSVAQLVIEAIETVVPLRRCTGRVGASRRESPCTPAQLGVASCPCAGTIDEAAYARLVARVVHGVTLSPAVLLDPLVARMRALASAARFEEAAAVRDRADALARALRRQQRLDAIRRSGNVEIEASGRSLRLRDGRLVAGGSGLDLELDNTPPGPGPVAKNLVDELLLVSAWLDANGARVHIVRCDGELAWPAGQPPRFQPARPRQPAA
ncbi:MAG TPA: DEDD exonuclease domain-containing protein [Acidimicrobiales bacterium]|nr:DEDD exonuclease domain-containing protein [Acidimicrobiales bacterium]